MRSATAALRGRVSNLYIIVGVMAIAWSLPARVAHQTLAGISNIAIVGGIAVIVLALMIRRDVRWAHDILLVTSSLMTLLAFATLLGGLSFLWIVIGAASAYLTWGLIKL